jgi:hypothetical protein
MSNESKPRQYYEDFYDRVTIDLCRNEEAVLRDLYRKGFKEEVAKLSGKKREDAHESLIRAINIFHYTQVELLAGERWEHRESGIKELMDENKDEVEQIEQARLTREPICQYCGKSGLRIISKDLMHRGPDYDQELVIFMLECSHCKKRSAVWEDSRPYEPPKTYCEKCKTEMGKKTSRRGEIITHTFVCPKCSRSFKENLDLRVTEDKPDKYWEIDKTRFLLDDERGKEYLEGKRSLEGISTLMADFKEREEHKEQYDAVAALKKVNIGQLQETLQPDIEKAGYTELRFEKPEMGRDVTIGFSCLDGMSDRAEYDSRRTLKKLVEKGLENTNWRLMSDGIFYRLGYLTGRLRAYEHEGDLLKLVEKNSGRLVDKMDGADNEF